MQCKSHLGTSLGQHDPRATGLLGQAFVLGRGDSQIPGRQTRWFAKASLAGSKACCQVRIILAAFREEVVAADDAVLQFFQPERESELDRPTELSPYFAAPTET